MGNVDEPAVDPLSDDDPLEAEVERVVEEFTGRIRKGEAPTVEEYAARHPALTGRLRSLLPAVLAVEGARPVPPPPPPPLSPALGPPPAMAAPESSFRLGDFRILREIGRGGMGIVYEAEQVSLGRRVALKVLPFHLLEDTRRLERFRREAKAAATLQHPHIVSVYGVGEEAGNHYYVMQYIEGESLDAVIAEIDRIQRGGPPKADARRPIRAALPAALAGGPAGDRYFAEVARLGADAAEALAYSHGQGVLHRDIKPSNLLLDRGGEVWVTDFGLAKIENSETLTRSGEVVGTLPYMAPERFTGWSDPRSDVYSLGLVIYELATLRPAFEDEDRSRLMRRIIEEEPAAPRKVQAKVPRDLETIILKAIAKEPGARYASAAALAADLRRCIAGEPILARQSGVVGRCAKWARRRPAAAALVATLCIAAAVITGGSLRYGARLEREGRHTRANLEKALEAVDRMLTWVGDEGLSTVPRIEPVRRGLLEEALRFHEGFLKEDEKDPVVRLGAARACSRVGQIYGLIGQRVEAKAAVARSIQLLEGLRRDFPENEEYRKMLDASRSLASLLASMDLPTRGAEVSRFPVPGTNVVDVAAADLDGDGRLDLIAANRDSDNLAILRNVGSRGFAAAQALPVGKGPLRVLACDIDGDRDADIISMDQKTPCLSILPNEGKGSFSERIEWRLQFRPWAIAILDADRDGQLEIAVAGGSQDMVLVKRAAGGGKMSESRVGGVPDQPNSLLAADIDGDGSTDLVVGGKNSTNQGLLAFLWNDGKGQFSSTAYAPGAYPGSLFAGDVNGDNERDLVVVDSPNEAVSVAVKAGKREFRPGTKFAFGPQTMGVGLADLRGSGRLDLVLSNEGEEKAESRSMVSILLSNGIGSFSEAVRFETGGEPFRGTIADLDGDGRPDIAVANGRANDVAVLFHVREVLGLPGRKETAVKATAPPQPKAR